MKIFRIIVLSLTVSYAEADLKADSLQVLGPREFFAVVIKYHPLSKQAELRVKEGEANLLKSRGGFDPKVNSDFSSKYFESTNYYQLFSGGITLPTWYGIELKGGYERNNGAFISPENKLPGNGLVYGGISANIGNGLFIDERRAVLQKAKVYRDLTLAEQRRIINELIFESGKAYWDWYSAYNAKLVYANALRLAEQRMEAVRQVAILGDRPFVDTLEAGIQLQERVLSLRQAELDFANKTLILSLFLWTEDEMPYDLPATVVAPEIETFRPDSELFEKLQKGIDTLFNNHPEILAYDYKLQSLDIDMALKKEQLKPTLKLNYNPLFERDASVSVLPVSENYKWGFTFSMPVFLRKERGDIQLTEIFIRDAELERKNKNLELLNKTKAYLNEFITTAGQFNLYTGTVLDYESLLNAERRIFEAGESSLFMINARELGFISARLKLIDLVSKNNKALLSAVWSAAAAGI